MIRVDDRVGSAEFLPLLKRLGAPCKIERLPFADFRFRGHGPDGSVRCGVERKTIDEIVTAMEDSRFVGHQLPGMLQAFDWVFLIVEGRWHPDPASGILMRGKFEVGHTKHRHLYENVEKFLLTLRLKARVQVVQTSGQAHTAYCVKALYDWAHKPWHAHKSAYRVDETKADTAILTARTMKRKVLAQIGNVGWKRSAAAGNLYPSIACAVRADPLYVPTPRELRQQARMWRNVTWVSGSGKTMSIGPKTAAAIVRVIHETEVEKPKGR